MDTKQSIVNVNVQLIAREDFNTEYLYDLTKQLMMDLENLEIETVKPISEEINIAGTKGADPITLGALLIVVAQTALPKVLEFLQAWSLRKNGQEIKIKVQHGDSSIEVEYPKEVDPTEIKKHIATIVEALDTSDAGGANTSQ